MGRGRCMYAVAGDARGVESIRGRVLQLDTGKVINYENGFLSKSVTALTASAEASKTPHACNSENM